MKGLTDSQLAAVDVELKEAVCDALINLLVARVSGCDERGRTILGRSPRRGIVAGQLLPRFDNNGIDETSDIRIATVGLDVVVKAGSKSKIRVSPTFSAYVRVIPLWSDLIGGGGELDFDFKLQKGIQKQIDDNIRSERQTALIAAGVDRPDWKALDETKRAKIRTLRGQILGEVRRKAYAAFGIKLLSGEPLNASEDDKAQAEDATSDPNTPDDTAPPISANFTLGARKSRNSAGAR